MNLPCLPKRYILLLCLSGVWGSPAVSQDVTSTPSGYSMDQLARRAGIIFSGTVVSIEMPHNGQSVVQVIFKVDEGIRGVQSGDKIVIREWVGLWSAAGGQGYRIGENVLMLLHRSDVNGLTSPVGGPAGHIRFISASTLKLSPEQERALRRSPRLQSLLAESDHSTPRKNSVNASSFLRALRLVANSQ